MSSSRDQMIFTGVSTCLAMRAAWVMKSTSSLRPNAPPMYWLCTATFSGGRPVSLATVACARTGTCVPTHRSAPSGRTCSVAFIGSIGACARNGSW